jgi:hypothetical protein
MADNLWSVRCVRKLWRQSPPRRPASSAAAGTAVSPVLSGHQPAVYVAPEEQDGHHQQFSVTGPRQVYCEKDRIIGAGTSFTALTLTVPLDKPLNAEDAILTFTGSALLGYIGTHLATQGAGDGQEHGYAHHPLQPNGDRPNRSKPLHFTYGLPHMDVGMVIAVPAPRGKKVPFLAIRRLPMTHPGSAPLGDIGRVAGRSPSAHPERLYLRASTASWDGQDCNIDIEEYEKQITTYVQNNTVIGSGNITTGGTINNSPVTNTTGDGNAKPGATGPSAGGPGA